MTVHGRSRKATVLAVSPHLDDAVMAVGATLAAHAGSGGEFSICTVFSGIPDGEFSDFAKAFHEDCGLGPDAVVRRRSEDQEAIAVLGGRAIHLDFLDAIYRRHGDEWLCPSARSLFDPDPPDEPELENAVTDALEAVIVRSRPTEVWTGAAIDEHLDHRLVRRSVEEACRRSGTPLRLWEGLPHHLGSDSPVPSPPPGTVAYADDSHMRRKLTAIAAYPSQIRMLWPDEDWRAAFMEHAARREKEHGMREIVWEACRHAS